VSQIRRILVVWEDFEWFLLYGDGFGAICWSAWSENSKIIYIETFWSPPGLFLCQNERINTYLWVRENFARQRQLREKHFFEIWIFYFPPIWDPLEHVIHSYLYHRPDHVPIQLAEGCTRPEPFYNILWLARFLHNACFVGYLIVPAWVLFTQHTTQVPVHARTTPNRGKWAKFVGS